MINSINTNPVKGIKDTDLLHISRYLEYVITFLFSIYLHFYPSENVFFTNSCMYFCKNMQLSVFFSFVRAFAL